MIDADPQGSLTKSCKIDNADADKLEVTLSELMAYEMTGEDKDYMLINNSIKQFETVDLIPSNISLLLADSFNPIKYCINSYAVISYLAVLFSAFFFSKATRSHRFSIFNFLLAPLKLAHWYIVVFFSG